MIYSPCSGESRPGLTVTNSYDALSRLTAEQQPFGSIASQYDLAGNRTRMTYTDGIYVTYAYDKLGLLTDAWWTRPAGTAYFLNIAYDSLGRRSVVSKASAASTMGYDAVSRLNSLSHDFTGTTNDVSTSFTHNPSSQIFTLTRNNDAFAWTGHFNQNTSSTPDGLNRIANLGTMTLAYDGRGNLTSDGATAFTYDPENRLVGASGAKNATLGYDPLGRLAQVSDAATRRMVYDGLDLVEEYDGSGNLLRRFAHGQGFDEPILTDEGTAVDCTGTRFPRADERGSIVALADCWGNATNINRYDEFGVPQTTNVGRFGYTGQAWLPELGLWYYKARMYRPDIGRFLQTDPIGYESGPNLYAYVGNDPVNWIDPLGLKCRKGGVVGGGPYREWCDPLNGVSVGPTDLFWTIHREPRDFEPGSKTREEETCNIFEDLAGTAAAATETVGNVVNGISDASYLVALTAAGTAIFVPASAPASGPIAVSSVVAGGLLDIGSAMLGGASIALDSLAGNARRAGANVVNLTAQITSPGSALLRSIRANPAVQQALGSAASNRIVGLLRVEPPARQCEL